LHIELPEGLLARQRRYPRALRRKLSPTGASSARGSELAAIEEDLKTQPELDPAAMLDVLKRHRDASDWNGGIRFAGEMPEPVGSLAEVKQTFALALNRRAEPGDRERAIALMHEVIDRTGGDSETYGILGHIYKDLHAVSGDRSDLDAAIEAYRAAF